MKQEYDFSHAERGKFHATGPLRLPVAHTVGGVWEGPLGGLGTFVTADVLRTLTAYRQQPHLVAEHANQEHDVAHDSYIHRQLYELVRNSADALRLPGTGQSILVRLTGQFLYCADDGKPIGQDGVRDLMFAHTKFGLSFRSLLSTTDAPEFFSRSGTIRFDRDRAAERIQRFTSAERYPVLTLLEPIDANREATADEDLRELMSWATNIVRLPLKDSAFDNLALQIEAFPPGFLLSVSHVRYLTLECAGRNSREFMLHHHDNELKLSNSEGSSP